MTSTFSISSLLIGLGAGATSAALFASLVGGNVFALPLFVLAPMPLVIAALGQGLVAGLISAATAAIALQTSLGTPAALVHAFAHAAPVLVACHLILRSTTTPEAETRWYPLGAVISATAVMVAIATTLGGLAIEFDPITTAEQVATSFREAMIAGGAKPTDLPDVIQMEPFLRASVRLMPAFFPAFWTLMLALSLWLGARIVAKSGRLARPWEDMASIEVPLMAGPVFAAGFAGSFLPGSAGLIASIAAGAAFAPQFLVGLGVAHHMARASDMRLILLATLYGLVLLFPIASLVVAMVGLAEPFVDLRGRLAARPRS